MDILFVMSVIAAVTVLAGIAAVCSLPQPFTKPQRNYMSNAKAALYAVLAVLAVLAGVAGLSFYGNGLDYLLNRKFAPLNEQVRHDTFECSASHMDGMAREIRQYQDQYATQDASGRAIIRQRVLQDAESQTGDCPFPADIQTFVNSLR
jgi:hypothetical protein